MKNKTIKNGIVGKLIGINGVSMEDITSPLTLTEILDNLYYQCMPRNRHRIDKEAFKRQLEFFIKEII